VDGRAPAAGFTLIEALVAIAILAVVVIQFLGTRTDALIDAADARNWRLARELAERHLSEIKAGALELPPQNKSVVDVERYPGFSYQVLIGEAAIADIESDLAGEVDAEASRSGEASRTDRLQWQQERDTLRRARAQGLSMIDYEDKIRAEELEERMPSETDLEDVAVVVYFPNVRPGEDANAWQSHFMLKAKVSTMALEGLTPEEVAQKEAAAGGTPGTGGGTTPGGGGER
jgi:prepilin-type N-terminal cleavage/methylation domain-containing protein